jgi:phosphate/sulfate permease
MGSVVGRGVLDTVRALIAIALLELGGQVLFTGVFLHSIRALLVEFQRHDDE